MTSWLKLIGSAKRPVSDRQEEHVGFRKATKPQIRTGDRLYLPARGKQVHNEAGGDCDHLMAVRTGNAGFAENAHPRRL